MVRPLETRALGDSALRISVLTLGTMTFGDGTNKRMAGRIIDIARERGVNAIDTADVNAGGESERILGWFLRRDRERWVLTTKPGPIGGRAGANRGGYTRERLARSIRASLDRLATDWIDLYVLDWDDPLTPLEETVAASGGLLEGGLARHWGLSNYRAWRIAETIRIADRLGVPRPIVGQPCYNAATRLAEVEYLPACAHFALGIMTYSPLARGVLTGKYDPDSRLPPPGTRAGRGDQRILETEFRRETLVIARTIATHAERRGLSAAQFTVAWILNNRLVTSVIAGPRTEDQWREYLGALDYRLTDEDEALVDSLVPPGGASTPGYADPAVPVTGRMPLA
jgi:aryl-alcohol dehydrogenase-like predicted oxidoreductase